jgi:phosphatidate cytidylyltransferase
VKESEAAPGGSNPKIKHSEIATRITSAVVLAAIALGAVFVSPWTFAVLVIIAGTIIAWEWGRLLRGTDFDAIAVTQAACITVVAVLGTLSKFGLALLTIAIAAAAIVGLSLTSRKGAWSLAGLAYAAFPALALVWLRDDPAFGVAAILFVLAVAWTTDTASYVGGHLIGGPKLAPSISPNKTWSGLILGIIAPALIGYATGRVLVGTSTSILALISMVIAAACQVGDLSESAVKRKFGAKDMSGLIPGHGGLLDRIDGLLFAALAAALIALRDPANPGRGLLIW